MTDNFTSKEVDTLYKYFVYEGLSDNQDICNWKINIEHIYSALRRHKGNVQNAGKDLSELLQNEEFDIRTFYTKNGDTNTNYLKAPYLSGQEWQIKPTKGMNLLYNNKVFEIFEVYDEYFTLKKVLIHNFTLVYFIDKDLRFGKYKKIKKKEVQKYLEIEYNVLYEQLNEVYIERAMWLNKKLSKREEYTSSIRKIEQTHNDNCTIDAKLKIIGKFNLPIMMIKKILSYNIESRCNHYWEIRDLSRRIEMIDNDIDNDYSPYKSLQWNIEVAGHILDGDYDDWLSQL